MYLKSKNVKEFHRSIVYIQGKERKMVARMVSWTILTLEREKRAYISLSFFFFFFGFWAMEAKRLLWFLVGGFKSLA